MEPVTHVLTGACLARTGLNRRAAYATVAMAVAAEFPDIDTLWSLRGPVSGFEHHRGFTHTLLGVPLEAALLLLVIIAVHQWSQHRRSTRPTAPTRQQKSNTPSAPVRWATLYVLLVLALLSHLILDYTNNYGIRPFFPFNPRWFAASIVFIFDPLIFCLLVAGLLLPSLFRLVGSEVGHRKRPFYGAGWARAALLGILCLWLAREYEHHKAIVLASEATLQAPADAERSPTPDASSSDLANAPTPPVRPLLSARKSIANPDPLSIFRWYTGSDFGPAFRLGTANTAAGILSPEQILNKPASSPSLSAAESSRLGRIYMDWAVMPFLSVLSTGPDGPAAAGPRSTVIFQDLRFMGSSPLLHRQGTIPLTGTVVVDPASGKAVAVGMDGSFEH